jgi:hypothetical protein
MARHQVQVAQAAMALAAQVVTAAMLLAA